MTIGEMPNKPWSTKSYIINIDVGHDDFLDTDKQNANIKYIVLMIGISKLRWEQKSERAKQIDILAALN